MPSINVDAVYSSPNLRYAVINGEMVLIYVSRK